MFHILQLAVLAGLAAPLFAQTPPPLVTDRPDFTESGLVVPQHHTQAELGLTIRSGPEEGMVSGPELLLRWTPFARVEVRFGAPDYVIGAHVAGFGDASVGTKIQFGPVGAWDLAVLAEASLPLGEDTLSSGRFDPLLLLIAGREFGPMAIGTQGELASTETGLGGGGTVVAGFGLSERLSTFLEVALSVEAEAEAAVFLHHGYTFLVTPGVQLDVHGALGLTAAAPDVLLGAGLSLRR